MYSEETLIRGLPTQILSSPGRTKTLGISQSRFSPPPDIGSETKSRNTVGATIQNTAKHQTGEPRRFAGTVPTARSQRYEPPKPWLVLWSANHTPPPRYSSDVMTLDRGVPMRNRPQRLSMSAAVCRRTPTGLLRRLRRTGLRLL